MSTQQVVVDRPSGDLHLLSSISEGASRGSIVYMDIFTLHLRVLSEFCLKLLNLVFHFGDYNVSHTFFEVKM